MRRIVRLGLVVLAPFTLIAFTASPASAHSSNGVSPTNYATELHARVRTPPGISLRVVDVETRLELENRGPKEAVVLGYDDEPYLRVGPQGVFENTRSPATYLNRTLLPGERTAMPRTVDADAPPRWRRISTGSTARWHDHRAHWMGTSPPPIVQRQPGRSHVVIDDWQIPMVVDRDRTVLRGDVVWTPGPSPWPWLVAAAVGAVLIIAGSRTRWWAVTLLVATAVMTVSEGIHLVGQWNATTAGWATKAWSAFYPALALGVALLATVQLARNRDPNRVTPLVLIAGLMVAITGGLGDLSALSRSHILFSGPPWLGRATVVVGLGFGVGLVIAASLRIRSPEIVALRNRRPPEALIPG